MMTCVDAERALAVLVFEDLDDETGARLHGHLLDCPRCRTEERRLLALRDAVRGETPPPDPELRARARAALPPRRAAGIGGLLGRPVPAYVAAAALLLGALLVAAIPARRVPAPATPAEA